MKYSMQNIHPLQNKPRLFFSQTILVNIVLFEEIEYTNYASIPSVLHHHSISWYKNTRILGICCTFKG